MENQELMSAMVLEKQQTPLVYKKVPIPIPDKNQALIKIKACGICRTDLHIVDAELTQPNLPLIPGHEIIGTVARTGAAVIDLHPGDLVGVPWLGYTCGVCKFCKQGKENLCDNARFTGYTIDGGYAEYTVANARFCFKLDTINMMIHLLLRSCVPGLLVSDHTICLINISGILAFTDSAPPRILLHK